MCDLVFSFKTQSLLVWCAKINLDWYMQAIMAEGKQHALSVGITKLSTQDMWVIMAFCGCGRWWLFMYFSLSVNKGIGVENIHYLCDGLWIMKDAQR